MAGMIRPGKSISNDAEIKQRLRVFLKADGIISAHELQKQRQVLPLLAKCVNVSAPAVAPFLKWPPV